MPAINEILLALYKYGTWGLDCHTVNKGRSLHLHVETPRSKALSPPSVIFGPKWKRIHVFADSYSLPWLTLWHLW